jgi:hypothetical protein
MSPLTASTYLVVDIGGPEASNRTVVRVRGKDGSAGGGRESLINVLQDI